MGTKKQIKARGKPEKGYAEFLAYRKTPEFRDECKKLDEGLRNYLEKLENKEQVK